MLNHIIGPSRSVWSTVTSNSFAGSHAKLFHITYYLILGPEIESRAFYLHSKCSPLSHSSCPKYECPDVLITNALTTLSTDPTQSPRFVIWIARIRWEQLKYVNGTGGTANKTIPDVYL